MAAFENTNVITEAITKAAKRAANHHKIDNVPKSTEKDGKIIVVQTEQL
jgi:hypothetical protein